MAVIDTTTRELVCLDRSNQVEYALQAGRLQALSERFRPDAIYAEQNAMGEPIVETLQRMSLPVYPFQTNNASKAAVIDALSLAFERGSCGCWRTRCCWGSCWPSRPSACPLA